LKTILVTLVAPRARRDELLGDWLEGTEHLATTKGARAARRWSRRQAWRLILMLAGLRLATAIRALRCGVTSPLQSGLSFDVVSALRRIARRPLVPVVVLLTIALGVAASTTVLTVADVVLFRPLPLPDSHRIVRLYSHLSETEGAGVPGVNLFDLLDIRRNSRTLVGLAPYLGGSVAWRTDTAPQQLSVARVGSDFLQVLGLRVLYGRWFEEAEFRPGGEHVAIVTHDFWIRSLGGSAAAVGSRLDLGGRSVQLVGVLPQAGFQFPSSAELWMPLALPEDSYLNNRRSVQLGALGRIAADASMESASTELAVLDAQLRSAYPDTSGRRRLSLAPLADTLAGPVAPMLWLLMGAVAAVLVIAAANVADLLLSDAVARRREFAVRSAMGGGSARLVRGLFAEALLLASAGGVLALLATPLLIAGLVALYPEGLPRSAEMGLDPRALLLGCVVTTAAGLIVALPVSLTARGVSLTDHLREGSRNTTGRPTRRLAATLVMVQVAASVALLSSGTVLLRTFAATARTDVGFDARSTLAFQVALAEANHPTPDHRRQFERDLVEAVERLPGVEAVGLTEFLPLAPGGWTDSFRRVGSSDSAPDLPEASIQIISPDLPRALGLRLIAGRSLTRDDGPRSPRVALVNRRLAQESFDDDAVGREIVFQDETWRIVGVLTNTRHAGLREMAPRQLYLPRQQLPRLRSWVLVRTQAEPLEYVPEVRSLLRTLDPTVPMTNIRTLEAHVSEEIAPERFRATLAGALGAMALLLAGIGLYGLVAHRVSEHRSEIGIRLALGEPARRVRGRLLLSALRLTAVGVIGGVGLSALSGRWIETLVLDELRPHDPLTLTAVSIVLVAVTLAAAWIPARRATRIDPIAALRSE
jgi:predicted permease